MAERAGEHDSSQADGSDGELEKMAKASPTPKADEELTGEKPAMEQSAQQQGGEKKPSKLKQLWVKSGLDL